MDELLDLNDHDEIAVYSSGNLVLVSTRETRFFEAWRQKDDAIIPASCVRTLTKAIFSERFYYRYWMWPQSQGLRGFYDTCRKHPAKGYHFDGLRALADLFANETYDTIRFRPISAFPEAGKYPPDSFKLMDEACTYSDWEKGYLLALHRFGDLCANSAASKKTVGNYSSDLGFLRQFVHEAERGRRGVVGVLTAFAWAYDAFFIPLRYFGAHAAMDFSRERLGYNGSDLSTFRRIFYKGGSRKDGHGLRLDPTKPFVIRQWSPVIAVNTQAAEFNGFDVRLLVPRLENTFERRVSLR
jgi:hypothetical protein